MTDFQVRVNRGNQMVSISLIGELDIATAPRLEAELRRVEKGQPSVLVIDLSELRFIDSSGIRLVLGADSRAREDDRRVAIVPGPESVHRVFQLALLDKRLEFVEDPSTL